MTDLFLNLVRTTGFFYLTPGMIVMWGIGLTLIQEILLGHGAEFALEDTGAGGSVFTIAF